MRQELADALNASTLDKNRSATIRERFARDGSPDKIVGAFTPQHAAHLAEVIADAEAEQAAEATNPKTLLRAKLDAAFYGTLTPRDPASGVTRPGHAHDGWRDGVSHPFTATMQEWPAAVSMDPKPPFPRPSAQRSLLRALGMKEMPAVGTALTFDVFEDEPDETCKQYEALRQLIDAGHLA